MKTQHFTVNKDNQKIRGIAYLCDRCEANLGEKAPAIIMSHGYLSSLSNYDYFAPKFCELGYNVYTFNFCCGSDETDPELKSDGDTKELCIEGEVNDLLAVYNYVTLQECVKSDEIYLWGESQGAFVSGLVAARLQEKVKKLVMIFPAVCIPDHARRGMLGGAVYDPMNPPDIMPTDRATLGRCFHDGVKDMNPYYELAEFKGETLLIQGDEDSVVVPQYQYLVKDAFDKTDAGIKILREKKSHRLHLQMVRGMDHWTGGEHREGLAESIKMFLDGREEILTFRIIVTNVVSLDDNDKLAGFREDKALDNEYKERDTAHKSCSSDIINTGSDYYTMEPLVHEQDVYFTGYCESDLFTGTIISGVDHQAYRCSECVRMCAEYRFVGVDENSEYCEMSVVNRKLDDGWKPEIKATSESLSWLNDADLSAVVECGTKGPTIRVYL